MRNTYLILAIALAWSVPARAQSIFWQRVLQGDVGATAAGLQKTLRVVGEVGKQPDCPTRGAAQPVEVRAPASGPTVEKGVVGVLATNEKKINISVVKKSMLAKIQDEVTNGRSRPTQGARPSGWRNLCTCKERAHLLANDLSQYMHLETGKLMVVPSFFGKIKPVLPFARPGKDPFQWNFHHANFIMVDEENGKPPVKYVIDPALFPNGPVPETEWETKLPGAANIYVTNRFAIDSSQRDSDYQSYPADAQDDRSIEFSRRRAVSRDGDPKCA